MSKWEIPVRRMTVAPTKRPVFQRRLHRLFPCISMFFTVFLLVQHPAIAAEKTVDEWICEAGNLDSDSQRLACLKQFRERRELDPSLRADIDRLIDGIERFLHAPRLEYFDPVVRKDHDWDFGLAADSPLLPLTYLYRARMQIWVTLEHGGIWGVPQRRREMLDRAVALLQKAKRAFPENKIVRMYLGEPLISSPLSSVPNAPRWAVWQREGLERLADIIEWWIDNRQRENGEYGGDWGDDCEMWRWWTPILAGFDSPKINEAQARFSRALLAQPYMQKGYSSHLTDVEHSAEDSADTITPMMHLEPDKPEWRARAKQLVERMESLWTGRNERGFLQFKSIYFSVDRVEERPERACDTVYHPRAMQPALLYWQRTADPVCQRLFSAWMDTWVDATRREERGKPAGIIPSGIHWPEGYAGGIGDEWWNPEAGREASLYRWPSAMIMMTHTLLLTYHQTGDEKYLEPIRSMAKIRQQYLDQPPENPLEPGSEAWCASRINLSSVLAKYRLLSGRTEFDSLLAREKSPYLQFRLHGQRESLEEALSENAAALSTNFEGYTSEVRYTDRVLRFPALFARGVLFEEGVPGVRHPNPSLLYSTVTGDPGRADYCPLNRVKWLTPPREIAALVTSAGMDHLKAELFHFGDTEREMGAELYLFDSGTYLLTLKSSTSNQEILVREFNVTGPRARVAFDLPARQETVMEIKKKD